MEEKKKGEYTYFLSAEGLEEYNKSIQNRRIERVRRMQEIYAKSGKKFAICNKGIFIVTESGRIISRLFNDYETTIATRLQKLADTDVSALLVSASEKQLVYLSGTRSVVSVGLSIERPERNVIVTDNAEYAAAFEESVFIVMNDGTLHVTHGSYPAVIQDAVSSWNNVRCVYPSGRCVAAIKSDKRIAFAGESDIRATLESWGSVKDIALSNEKVFALFENGTVSCMPSSENMSQALSTWRNIVMIAATDRTLYGLRDDGTVVTQKTSFKTENTEAEKALSSIVAIATSGLYFAALDADNNIYVKTGSSDLSMWPTDFYKNYINN